MNEYEAFKDLINCSQKNTLDSAFSVEATQLRSYTSLLQSDQVCILYDSSDIRKASALKMEG